MDHSLNLFMAAPPLPYYLESGRTVHRPGDQHPNRTGIGVFDLIVVESGDLHIGEEDRLWSLTPGQSVVLLPDRRHFAVKPSETESSFYWIHFQTAGQWTLTEQEHPQLDAQEHAGRFAALPYALHLKQAWTLPYPERAYELLRKMNEAGGKRQSSAFWMQQQLFEELLRMMDLRQNEGQAGPVVALAEAAEAYIKSNYRSPLTGARLAKALNFHYNYITRCMKQVYGLTPMDYLAKVRMEQAKLLLLKTEWPVADIAREVGFDSAPYFTSCFTQLIGQAPSKFRKRYMS